MDRPDQPEESPEPRPDSHREPHPPSPTSTGPRPRSAGEGPHDAPSAAELVAAVREYLENDVLPAVDGRVRFHGLVAANVLGMVERELTLGPAQAAAYQERLDDLGLSDTAELAAAIRSGDFDDRAGEIRELLRATVRDKLAVADPRLLDRQES